MLTLKDITVEDDEDYPLFSLNKIMGKQVKDIHVQIDDENYLALDIVSIEFVGGAGLFIDDHSPAGHAYIDDYSNKLHSKIKRINGLVKKRKNVNTKRYRHG